MRLSRRILVHCVSLLATACSAPRLSASAQDALASLQAETTFASAVVGGAGLPSPQARRLRRLLADPAAPWALATLWQQGRPAGRLYALVGYALTDPAAFARLAPALQGDTSRVDTVMGCIVGSAGVGEIVERLMSDSAAVAFRPSPATVRADSLMEAIAGRLAFHRRPLELRGN